ncbi:unnamed protein product [Mucor hiemalis]
MITQQTLRIRRGDFYGNQKRHEGKKKIFDVLQKEVHATNTLIDFVYFCVTDSECYDLRMSETRTNKSVLEKGIDNWMHRVQHLKEIWDEVNSKGSKLPHIIKIQFTDILTHRTGSLCIFDLLQPKFLPPRESIPNNSSSCDGTANSYINESFQQLLELLDKVISPAIVTKDQFLHINLNVLTSLLAPFLCGYGKLVLFSYVMEYPKFLKLETVLALDFVIMLRSIKCKALHLHQSAADSSLRNRIHCLQYQSKKLQEEICCKDRLIKKLQLEKEISNKILIERTIEYNSETLKMERKIKDMNSNFALAKQNYYTDTKQPPLQSSCLNDEMINERRKNLKLHNTLSSANAKINLAKQHFLKLQKMVEKASMNAAEYTNKIKSMAFHRISRLKRQLRNQKIQQIKEEKLLDILQKENNRLRQSVRVKEVPQFIEGGSGKTRN